ncbi:hypothetical protein PCE1_000230 [Barthelona sp. PCE]
MDLKSEYVPPAEPFSFQVVSEDVSTQLLKETDINKVRKLVSDSFDVVNDFDDKFIEDFLVDTVFFAQIHAFSPLKLSCLLSLLTYLHDEAFEHLFGFEKLYSSFKSLLLQHCFDEPPRSIIVFSFNDINIIMDLFLNRYLRHYYALRSYCTPMKLVELNPIDYKKTIDSSVIPKLSEGAIENEQSVEIVDLKAKEEADDVAFPTKKSLKLDISKSNNDHENERAVFTLKLLLGDKLEKLLHNVVVDTLEKEDKVNEHISELTAAISTLNLSQ